MESIESVDNLKKVVGQNNAILNVLGYYEPGDGGGGLFYFDSLSEQIPNDGTIIKPNNNDGRWIRSFSGNVKVKWFGAKGDGVNLDTEKIQSAANYCESYKKTLELDGLFVIDNGIYFSCSVNFLEFGYNSSNLQGIKCVGSNYIAVTFQPGVRISNNIIIDCNNCLGVKGLFLNNNVISNHTNIRVVNADGFGFKATKMWDSVVSNVSVELCGSSTEHAFIIDDGGDSSNMTNFSRIQVEQSKGMEVYISPTTLCCVFENIHCERSIHDYSTLTNTTTLGGNRCLYNSLRFDSNGLNHSIEINAANTTFDVPLIESGFTKIVVNIYSNSGVCINNPEFQCPLTELSDQTGRLNVISGKVIEVNGYTYDSIYRSVNIAKLAISYVPLGKFAQFDNCRIGDLFCNDSDSRLVLNNNTSVENITKLPYYLIIDRTTVNYSGSIDLAYKTLEIKNGSIWNGSINFDFSTLIISNSQINGSITYQAGNRNFLFHNAQFNGTVNSFFNGIPALTPLYGLESDVPQPSTGNPYKYIVAAVSGNPTWITINL